MRRQNTSFRPRRLSIDPSRAVLDASSRPPAELLDDAPEQASYSHLDEPAEVLGGALAVLFEPGRLELGRSELIDEANALVGAIAALRGWLALIRRTSGDAYGLSRACELSPPFLRARFSLTGILASKVLWPSIPFEPHLRSDLLKLLLRVRVEAVLTLITAGSRAVADHLAARLTSAGSSASEGSYFAETLRLFYQGLPGTPYPLTPAEAVSKTEWFRGERQGESRRLPHVPPSETCEHCTTQKVTDGAMRLRHHRLRARLATLVVSGLAPAELGVRVAHEGRRQAP